MISVNAIWKLLFIEEKKEKILVVYYAPRKDGSIHKFDSRGETNSCWNNYQKEVYVYVYVYSGFGPLLQRRLADVVNQMHLRELWLFTSSRDVTLLQ